MTTNESRPAALPEDEIDLLEVLGTLWGGKYWIAGAVFLALVVGVIVVLRTEPIYQARGLLQLETRSGTLALPEGMQDLLGGGAETPSETEIEIMKSRMVMGQVVRDLDLQIYAAPLPLPVLGLIPKRLSLPDPQVAALRPYQWGNEAIEIGELELPQDWLGQDILLTITEADGYSVLLPDGTEHAGKARVRLALPEQAFSLVVDQLEGPSGRQFHIGRMGFDRAVAGLQRSFSVRETSRSSSILQVTFQDPDPRRAERILDAVAQSYLDQNISRSAAEAESSIVFIEEQLPLAQQAVNDAQVALNAYRQQQQSVDVDYETRSLLERGGSGNLNSWDRWIFRATAA